MGEVVRALEEAKYLREQLDKAHAKCECQETEVSKLTKKVADCDEEIARLNRDNASEREAVSSLRNSVQELRASLVMKEGELEQTLSQLEESKRMFSLAI